LLGDSNRSKNLYETATYKSDAEDGNNLMLPRLTPVATLIIDTRLRLPETLLKRMKF